MTQPEGGESVLVARWSGIVQSAPNGGFVAYGDYLRLKNRFAELERELLTLRQSVERLTGENAGLRNAQPQFDQIISLRMELDAVRQERDGAVEANVCTQIETQSALDSLRKEAAGLREDAGRYRWLRERDIENSFPRHGIFIGEIRKPEGYDRALSGPEADFAIDASMAEDGTYQALSARQQNE